MTGVEQAERFRADVLAEPATLAVLLDAYLGPGSPLAALAAASLLRAHGVDAAVERTSAAAPMPSSPETLAVVVSASGRTPETVEAAERHRGTSRVVAVTNHPERPLTQLDRVLLMAYLFVIGHGSILTSRVSLRGPRVLQ